MMRLRARVLTLVVAAVSLGNGGTLSARRPDKDKRAEHAPPLNGEAARLVPDEAGGTVALMRGSEEVLRLSALTGEGAAAGRIESWKPRAGGGFDARFAAGEVTMDGAISLGEAGTVTVRPGPGLAGVAVRADMQYAVIPSRWVGQQIYPAEGYKPAAEVHLPAEGLLAGLCPGGGRMIALVWPAGDQSAALRRDGTAGAKGLFAAATVMLAGRALHLAAFDAPGIWHRESLRKDQLDKKLTLDWTRPFAATWVTQLQQLGVATACTFEDKPFRRWWPGVGHFQWPAWFEDGRGCLQLSKNIPPVGEAVIFPLAGHDKTPFGLVGRALSSAERAEITECGPTTTIYALGGNRPPYVWPRHCDGHKYMRETILVVAAHQREWEFMHRHIEERVIEDVAVARQGRRYRDMLDGLARQLPAWAAAEKARPDVLAYLERMKADLADLEATYARVMEGQTPEEYEAAIRATAERFKGLVQDPGPERLAEMRVLLAALNEPKSRVENFGRHFGGRARQWYHDSAAAAATVPGAPRYARIIRESVRKLLAVRSWEAHGRYLKDMR